MDMDDPHFRDCARDVVAMLEAAMTLQSAGGPHGEAAGAAENLKVLLTHADSAHCLQVAVSMLATSWALVTHVRADARGTTPADELADILAEFRDRLA